MRWKGEEGRESEMALNSSAWRRFGHDRTYLTREDDTPIGWIDNSTGEIHAASDELRAEVETWRATVNVDGVLTGVVESELGQEPSIRNSAIDAESHAIDDEPALDAPDQMNPERVDALHEWEDLALRRPGQAVREQAKTELSAMWQESKFKTALRVAFDTHTDERAWRLGASGEETIGAKLEKLSSHGWYVLHSVPIGERGSDVDHIVIGPGGVWTINAKNHPGKKIWVAPRQIRVGGQPVPYIRNSEFEANRVRKILNVELGWEPFVRAALVFMTGTLVPDVTIKGKPEHVEILDRMDVNRRLKREPMRMTAEQADAVFAVARRSTTWVR